jgi:hypothetical protein
MDDRRALVEDLPHLNASDLVWSGTLDQPWRLGTSSGEPGPWAQLAAAFAGRDDAGHAVPLVRVVASSPAAHGPDRIALDIEFHDSQVHALAGKQVTRRIELVATRAPFGGARWWFRCDGCNSRRAFLYPTNELRWMCRECLGLSYRSRAKYGRPWERRRARGALNYCVARFEAHEERVARASYRRKMSRARKKWRDHQASVEAWPVALTCRPASNPPGG